jgi:hypothetical protein
MSVSAKSATNQATFAKFEHFLKICDFFGDKLFFQEASQWLHAFSRLGFGFFSQFCTQDG